MDFLRLLEKIRLPGLNELMLGITYLGDEIAFLAIALVLFWCVDKRRAYYLMAVGFIGTIANQFMKLFFRVPRPWVQDPEFTIVEQAREGASGYSFPSGHTQSAVGTFGGLAYTSKQRWVRIAGIAIAVLVTFSRMYLGVHTPLDVTVSAVIGIILVLLLRPLVLGNDGKYLPWVIGFMTVLAFSYLLYVELFPFPENIDAENLLSGKKNAYTLFGCLLGLIVVYVADVKWLHFPVKAVWWAQISKILIGLAIVMVVKSGLSHPLTSLFGYYIGRMVRYFLVVVTAGCLWPLSFRYFEKLGNTEQK